MKLGLIADIHGNIEALDAVLLYLEQEKVDLILCAGDLVTYGANPNSVIQRLKERGIMSVCGNYDDAVAWGKPRASRRASSPQTETLKRVALEWTRGVLRPENKRYLQGLPWLLGYQLAGKQIAVLHAGLNYLDEWLEPEDQAGLARVAARLKVDIVVLAHTHRAFCCRIGKTLFVNPGAVGRALDRDTRAACALLNLTTLSCQHLRVTYDLSKTLEAIRRSAMPRAIAWLLSQGVRRIEEVRHA